ncbi:mitochondrial import inner membrane translocase subunit TIM16 [Plasmodium brasilianum]|uniref:Mitochondrial import inner membrane translocase subunit TIM16, putative n=2 Tax=Plasmodium (Plasmodium) TaxID=418103 RepID=A0A1D3RIB0_PLAMA|nr:mitochondrial import inner membrane translocase subunit TIM16, putative [Plasmodium malariae]KAI4837840.1 mitochondrial import inner membrane translocase subunit TIM16 [Plasmodium brasilianum]SCN44922.1 mitochondrial import inner membrane translocase subunit TIM16, putative [Plasmodium malariae]
MLPFRPLSQFVFQFLIITSTALGKAFIQAYKEIIKNKHNTHFIKEKYNSCMNVEEALNILNLDKNKIYKKLSKEELKSLKEEINNRHLVLNKLNEKSGPYNGSAYIQKKAQVAKEVLLQHLKLQ